MRGHSLLLLFICTLLAGVCVVAWGQTATVPAKGPGSRLGVVNMRQVFEGLDEKADMDRALELARQGFVRDIDQLKEEIQKLSAEVERPTVFKRGSPEHVKMQDDLLQKASDVQAKTQLFQQKLFIQLRTKTLEIQRKLEEAVAEYARANDVGIVMVSSELDVAAARTVQELEGIPVMRKLAYYHPVFDVTRAVTERMNSEHRIGPRR